MFFAVFLNDFDALMVKNKNKKYKYYFNIFINKNYFWKALGTLISNTRLKSSLEAVFELVIVLKDNEYEFLVKKTNK